MRSDEGTSGVVSTSYSKDDNLIIVGPGVLGGLIGKLWKDNHPEAQVFGVTNTDANHKRLRDLGIVPELKQHATGHKAPFVIFSAPPSGSADYLGEVKNSLHLWDGRGAFIFTSSIGVFKPVAGKPITEETPLQAPGTSQRIDRLLDCEKAVLEAGGCVVRLAGLYHAKRGAHTFFLRQGEVARAGNHIVNLIHYEDAAAICLKVLQGEGRDRAMHRSQTYLGTDSQPLTFQEMMDATAESGKYQGSVVFTAPPEKTPAPGSSNSWTRKILDWTPKYHSFQQFMEAGAEDFYSISEAAAG